MGLGELRVEGDGLPKVADGLLYLPLGPQCIAQAVVGLGVLRVEGDGLSVAGDGLVKLALARQRIAQVVVGHGVLRVEDDGLLEAGDGPVVIPFIIAEYSAQAAVGRGGLRVEVDGRGGCWRWPPPPDPWPDNAAQVVVGPSELRVECDGRAVARDGLVHLALVLQPAHRPGCSGPGRTSDRVRWPCGSWRWPPPPGPW